MMILGIGEVLWDEYSDGREPGGAPLNFAFHARQLGADVRLVSRVGMDPEGDALREAVRKLGVDPSFIQTDSFAKTCVARVTPGPDGQPRYAIPADTAWDRMRWTPTLLRPAQSADAVCFGTLAQRSAASRAAILRTLDEARGALRVLDLNLRPPYVDRLVLAESLIRADWLKASVSELETVARMFELAGSTPAERMRAVRERFPRLRLVIATDGENGCRLQTATQDFEVPAAPAKAVDSVGAGDAFTAALVVESLSGRSLEQAAATAAAIAALVVGKRGGTPVLTPAEIAAARAAAPAVAGGPSVWRPPVIDAGKYRLRPVTEADIEAIFAYCSDPRMTEFTLWETHERRQDSEDYVRQYAFGHYRDRIPEPLAIVKKTDKKDRILGTVGGWWVSRPDAVMELGYAVGVESQGKGVATEAAQAMIAHLFETYAVERLQARVMSPNAPSLRVLEKLGFTREGSLRSLVNRRDRFWDVDVYSLLRGEWQAGKGRE